MKAIALLAVFVLASVACPKPLPPPAPPAPDADTDGGPATCASACARLQVLGCPAGAPTPKGAPCVEVCENVQSSGIVSWDLDCIARGVTCGSTDRCTR
ncbi:MAG: hypothetical protein ABUS79_03650 [Pseudomonadota bacterium]